MSPRAADPPPKTDVCGDRSGCLVRVAHYCNVPGGVFLRFRKRSTRHRCAGCALVVRHSMIVRCHSWPLRPCFSTAGQASSGTQRRHFGRVGLLRKIGQIAAGPMAFGHATCRGTGPGTCRLAGPGRMGRRHTELLRQSFLATRRAGRGLVAAQQVFEFVATLLANVFVDWHGLAINWGVCVS
jgi:hypothetical protein